jgi:type IV pilus assembly protein PilV
MPRGQMEMTRQTYPLHTQRGTTLLEVLITIVILAIGLLGLAGLQARLQSSEMEAYQRSQALILLNDMASRIATNRANAANYETASPLGVGAATACNDTSTRQKADACEWSNALQGAGETLGGGSVGAMVGGRGCVEDLGENEYLITVAWQGLTPISAPPASVACGLNLYNDATGSACKDDLCRRTVTTIVRIGNLSS